MDGPFVGYRELIPSTNHEQASFFRIFDEYSKQIEEFLCVATNESILIYKVNRYTKASTPAPGYFAPAGKHSKYELTHKLYHRLFGKIKRVEVYQSRRTTAGQPHDLLVFGVDLGKIIVAEYLPVQNEFQVVKLCNAEENAFGLGAQVHAHTEGQRIPLGTGDVCHITVSDEHCLVASVVYGKQLLFLPIDGESNTVGSVGGSDVDVAVAVAPVHKSFLISELARKLKMEALGSSSAVTAAMTASSSELTAGMSSRDVQQHHQSSGLQPFICDLRSAPLHLLGPVIDLCFVPGYGQPVVAVLQEKGLLPIGHAMHVRSTYAVTLLAIDTVLKTAAVIWHRDKLPSDSVRLVPLHHPALAGAVAVVSLNALLVVTQEITFAVAMNGFAAISVDQKSVKLQPWADQEEGIELDASRWIEDYTQEKGQQQQHQEVVIHKRAGMKASISQHTLVGSLKDGRLISVDFIASYEGYISSIHFTPCLIGASIPTTCFATSARGDLWFLCSRQASSVLLAVARRSKEIEEEFDEDEVLHDLTGAPRKYNDADQAAPVAAEKSIFLSSTRKRVKLEATAHSPVGEMLTSNGIHESSTALVGAGHTEQQQQLQQQQQAVVGAADCSEEDLPSLDFAICCLDVISAMSEGLGPMFVTLVNETNNSRDALLSRMFEALSNELPELRQSGYSLAGEICKNAFELLNPETGGRRSSATAAVFCLFFDRLSWWLSYTYARA